jgi:energy-coupling factor transporter ATP-binding protein EcfA2
VDKVKLKRLKIEKYRNVAPGTELVFNDGFNVLLGQNGTGKTTLLKLIAMVTASRFGSLKETAFSFSYTLGFPGASVIIAIENARSDSAPILGEPFVWAYSIVLSIDGLSHTLTARTSMNDLLVYEGEHLVDMIRIPAANPFERGLLAHAFLSFMVAQIKELQSPRAKPLLNLAEFEGKNAANGRRFDEILDGLDSITGASSSSDTPSASFQFVRPTNGVSPKERDRLTFIPGQLELMMKAHDPSARSLDGLAAQHEDIDFLHKAVDLMGFKGAEMLLRLRKREPAEDGERLTFGNFAFTMILDDETVIPHDSLSYGQKRLLAFLYYVAANDDVIIADEIVNGMHYNWIEACLREIGDRQSFLTSQNPLLIDFLPFKSEQDVEHTFILCGHEQRDGRRHMSWKNMPEEDALTFFRSYKTQALQVSEILRSRGWW